MRGNMQHAWSAVRRSRCENKYILAYRERTENLISWGGSQVSPYFRSGLTIVGHT